MLGRCRILAALCYLTATTTAYAADEAVYFLFDIDRLRPYAPAGAFDVKQGPAEISEQDRSRFRPHVAVDGTGEAYWYSSGIRKFEVPADLGNGWGQLVARLPSPGDFVGTLYYPNSTYTAFRSASIRIPAAKAVADVATRSAFYTARRAYYESLRRGDPPGGAWFRHQVRESALAIHGTSSTMHSGATLPNAVLHIAPAPRREAQPKKGPVGAYPDTDYEPLLPPKSPSIPVLPADDVGPTTSRSVAIPSPSDSERPQVGDDDAPRQTPQVELPPDRPPLAIDGYCPVSLIRNKAWKKGDPRFGATHRGRTYLFFSAAEQALFLFRPDAYSPILSGNDPVAWIDEGKVVPGSRKHGVMFRAAEGREMLILFEGEDSRRKFTLHEKRYESGIWEAIPDLDIPTSERSQFPNFERPADEVVMGFLHRTFTADNDRAAAEALDLDRLLTSARADQALVPLDSLRTAPLAKFNRKPRPDAEKPPALDPPAAYVPADQYVLFCPTFDGFIRLIDETAGITSFARAFESRSEDYRLIDRYRRQLGIRVTAATRLLGSQMIQSVALTGGDESFQMGTDFAVLFEARDPTSLNGMLRDRITGNTAEEPQLKRETGEMLGVAYDSWTNDLRTVSSYVAKVDNVVVLTNSLVQLRRIVETRQRRRPAIAELEEYHYFRERYRLGDADETALLIVSAAALHRSSGPRQKIGESRRLRDAAVLAEMHAENLPALAGGNLEPQVLATEFQPAGGGTVELTNAGIRSSTAGSLNFQTPVAELDLDQVTTLEARAYGEWLDNRLEDDESVTVETIAVRFTVVDDRLAIDLTTTANTDSDDEEEIVGVLKGGKLTLTSGDPHGAGAHAVLAFNRDSPLLKQLSNQPGFLPASLQVDLLGWLGGAVSVYAADDPLWNELAKLETEEERAQFALLNIAKLPLALNIEIASAVKATALLTALRGLIDVADPGMATWEAQNYGDYSYVKVRVKNDDEAAAAIIPDISIYYALTAELLTVTPSEALIKAALDRQALRDGKPTGERKTAAATSPEMKSASSPGEKPRNPWLGENIAVEAGELAVRLFVKFFEVGLREDVDFREKSWSNLPILNEWKRLFPDQDPVVVHERLWGAKLVCPGNGQYVWNEQWRTMESTVYGHPDEPKEGDAPLPLLHRLRGLRVGVTFEDPGLRVRVELKRQP